MRLSDEQRKERLEQLIRRARATENRAITRDMRPMSRAARAAARGKFAGALPGPMTRREIDSPVGEMSRIEGRAVTAEELIEAARQRRIEVR